MTEVEYVPLYFLQQLSRKTSSNVGHIACQNLLFSLVFTVEKFPLTTRAIRTANTLLSAKYLEVELLIKNT